MITLLAIAVPYTATGSALLWYVRPSLVEGLDLRVTPTVALVFVALWPLWTVLILVNLAVYLLSGQNPRERP